jgi:hypothetical protein
MSEDYKSALHFGSSIAEQNGMSRIHTDTLNETKKNGMMHHDTKLLNSWREGERARWTNKPTQATLVKSKGFGQK